MGHILNRPDSFRYEEEIEGLGITVEAMQAVARRQFVGSFIVAVFVVGVAGLMASRPTHQDFSEATAQTARSVQQPTFAAPRDHVVAAVKRTIETP
jgi:hypothetical protein